MHSIISFVFIQISAFGIWKENRNIKHSFALPQGNFKWWRLLNHHFFKMLYRNFENVQHQQRYKRTNTGMSKNNDESDQLLIYQRFQDILIFLFNLSIINWVYISFLSWSKLKDIEIQLNAVRSFKCFYTLRLWKLEVLVLFVRILEFFFPNHNKWKYGINKNNILALGMKMRMIFVQIPIYCIQFLTNIQKQCMNLSLFPIAIG